MVVFTVAGWVWLFWWVDGVLLCAVGLVVCMVVYLVFVLVLNVVGDFGCDGWCMAGLL